MSEILFPFPPPKKVEGSPPVFECSSRLEPRRSDPFVVSRYRIILGQTSDGKRKKAKRLCPVLPVKCWEWHYFLAGPFLFFFHNVLGLWRHDIIGDTIAICFSLMRAGSK